MSFFGVRPQHKGLGSLLFVALLAVGLSGCAPSLIAGNTAADLGPRRNEAGIWIERAPTSGRFALVYPLDENRSRFTLLPPGLQAVQVLESRQFPERGEWAAIIRVQPPAHQATECPQGAPVERLVMSSPRGYRYNPIPPSVCGEPLRLGSGVERPVFGLAVGSKPFLSLERVNLNSQDAQGIVDQRSSRVAGRPSIPTGSSSSPIQSQSAGSVDFRRGSPAEGPSVTRPRVFDESQIPSSAPREPPSPRETPEFRF